MILQTVTLALSSIVAVRVDNACQKVAEFATLHFSDKFLIEYQLGYYLPMPSSSPH